MTYPYQRVSGDCEPFLGESMPSPRAKRCRAMRRIACGIGLVALFSVAVLGAYHMMCGSNRNDNLSRMYDRLFGSSSVNWDKWTAFGTATDKHGVFVWRKVWDYENSRFRVDAVEVHSKGDDEDTKMKKINHAIAHLTGQHHGDDGDWVGRPATGIFLKDTIYGLYEDKEGSAACRTYKRTWDLPQVDPTHNATDSGLEYARFVLAEHYSDLDIPGKKEMGVTASDLWVNAFTSEPVKAEIQGKFEHEGETYDYDVIYRIFKFIFNQVDDRLFTIPDSVSQLCGQDNEHGHRGTSDRTFMMMMKAFPYMNLLA